jgi:hypothetical protein
MDLSPRSKQLAVATRAPLRATATPTSNWLSKSSWIIALCCALLAGVATSKCRAEDAPSVVGYGFEGLGTGAAMGLGVGYLSTGSDWDSGEWKKLVYGTAIGALGGLGVGILLGIVDASTTKGRGVGFYMLRDSNYGVSVGFIVGGIVGVLKWIGDGSAIDVVKGLAWGTVIGGGAGFIVGIIEGALRSSSSRESLDSSGMSRRSRLHFGVAFTPNEVGGVGTPYPTLSGRF